MHMPSTTTWLLPVLFGGLAHASPLYYEFRECPRPLGTGDVAACRSECSPFGASPGSFEVDANQQVVSEKTWLGADMLTQRQWSGCTIKDAQNWRCQTEAEMMGGRGTSGFVR